MPAKRDLTKLEYLRHRRVPEQLENKNRHEKDDNDQWDRFPPITTCECQHRCNVHKSVKWPNDQKLRHPESNVSNNQKTHSQNRRANEGLPPALC
jgi:hypothetical protein